MYVIVFTYAQFCMSSFSLYFRPFLLHLCTYAVTEATGGVVATAQSHLNRKQSGKSFRGWEEGDVWVGIFLY